MNIPCQNFSVIGPGPAGQMCRTPAQGAGPAADAGAGYSGGSPDDGNSGKDGDQTLGSSCFIMVIFIVITGD